MVALPTFHDYCSSYEPSVNWDTLSLPSINLFKQEQFLYNKRAFVSNFDRKISLQIIEP